MKIIKRKFNKAGTANINCPYRKRGNPVVNKESRYERLAACADNAENYIFCVLLKMEFEALGDYKNARGYCRSLSEKALPLQAPFLYDAACTLMQFGTRRQLKSAAEKFEAVSDYKDAKSKAGECRKMLEARKK